MIFAFQRAWGRIIDTEADVLDPSRAPKVFLKIFAPILLLQPNLSLQLYSLLIATFGQVRVFDL